MELPPWLSGKETACNAETAGEAGSIPGSGRSPGGGYGNPPQYSGLENPMDRGTWQATVQRVDFPGGSVVKNLPAMRETWVQSLGQEDLEKEMAAHSSILSWRIPWTEEPSGLQSWDHKELDTAE